MSDSLRDQLLQAGFEAPKPKAKPKAKPHSKSRVNPNNKSRRGGSSQQHTGTSTAQTQTTNTGQKPSSHVPGKPQIVVGYTDIPAAAPKKKKSKKAPAVKSRGSSWSTRGSEQQATTTRTTETGNSDHQLAEKEGADGKKGQIHALIESTMLKEHKGEAIYRFTWQNKIRELLVSEKIRGQLANGELAITWLNGRTCLIPAETASSVKLINDKWRLFINAETADDQEDEHPVPDDLIW